MATTGSVTAKGKAAALGKPKGDHFKRVESKIENLDYLIGHQIWIKIDSDELFALAEVKSFSGAVISVMHNGELKNIPLVDCLNADFVNPPLEVNDLVKLPHANSAVVLEILRKRFLSDCIYTYAGKLLIVLNPFKLIPNLYGPQCIERYRRSGTSFGFPTDLPPHTYAIAQCALNGVFRDDKCQSCVVSGESGAGKTETAKQLMGFFAHGAGNTSDKVQQVIMGSNAILEAFGNAKTLRNNNSSRFGKFIKILVAPEGGLKGGIISSYMLELSRIEFQSENERNYHIFYQCLKGLSPSEKAAYGFLSMDSYKFLNTWKCYDAPGIDDVKEFGVVQKELKTLYSDAEYDDFMRCISGILLCGNIEFEEVTKLGVDNAASIKNKDVFSKLCECLGLEAEKASRALSTKVVTIQGDSIESAITVAAAEVNVRALAKDLYGALFEFCIDKINSIISFDEEASRWIGILDIYGFEYFKRNTYEQLLINYANERLQQYFINRVFASEIAEYDAEGIDHSSITYTDNSQVLLVFDKPNASIFSFLEEQCLIQTGSAESFTASCKNKIKNELFIPANGNVCRFTIVHTATSVVYDTDEFVAKNKHKLGSPIVEMLHTSKNSIVNQASQRIPVEVGNMKGKFLGSKFQTSIGALMKSLHMTDSHFIRCIKTNQQKQALLFETKNVYGQLISLSIIEAIQTIHRGYAYRATFEKFIKDNDFLSSFLGPASNRNHDIKAAIQGIMQNLCIPDGDYQVGNTKVFLKKNGWMLLEKVFLQYAKASKPLASTLHSIFRVWKNRQHLLKAREVIVRIQANIRRYSVQKTTLAVRDNVGKFVSLMLILDVLLNEDPRIQAAVVIQSCWRMFACRKLYLRMIAEAREREAAARARENLKRLVVVCNVIRVIAFLNRLQSERAQERAATKIAACWRMHVAIRRLNNLRLRKILEFAATFIQKHVRGYLQRKAYRYTMMVIPHVVRIQAAFRSWLAVRHLDPCIRSRIIELRENERKNRQLSLLQAFLRSVICAQRVYDAQCAVLCLQKFGWAKSCNEEITQVQHSASKIKDFLKRCTRQSAIREERTRIYREADHHLCERLTCEETQLAHRILEKYKASSIRCIVPIHCNVYSDNRDMYPEGWGSSLEALLLTTSHTRELTAVGMESKKTIVVLGGTHVYAFGKRTRVATTQGAIMPMPRLVTTVANPLRVMSVHCGADHTVLVLSDRSMYAWGGNSHGQCGIAQRCLSVKVPTLIRITDRRGLPACVRSVATGGYHNCAIGDNGEVMVWGRSQDINLPSFSEDVIFPVQLNTSWLPTDDTVEEACCGNRVSYLVTRRGRLFSFGSTYNGQLGREHVERAYPKQVQLPGRLISLGCGKNYTVAILDSFDIYIFGTALAIRDGRHLKETFTCPRILQCNRVAMRSPAIKCSAGLWECNVITEDRLIWAWTYLLLEGNCVRPVVYKYTCLGNMTPRDVNTVSSSDMAITLASF